MRETLTIKELRWCIDTAVEAVARRRPGSLTCEERFPPGRYISDAAEVACLEGRLRDVEAELFERRRQDATASIGTAISESQGETTPT